MQHAVKKTSHFYPFASQSEGYEKKVHHFSKNTELKKNVCVIPKNIEPKKEIYVVQNLPSWRRMCENPTKSLRFTTQRYKRRAFGFISRIRKKSSFSSSLYDFKSCKKQNT